MTIFHTLLLEKIFMIKINFFWIKKYYFSYDFKKHSALTTVSIVQLKENIEIPGFKKQLYNTWITDLTNNEEDIYKNFSSTIRNEINRAKKEWIEFFYHKKITKKILKKYIKHYNTFLKSKNMLTLFQRIFWFLLLNKLKKHLFLSYSMKDNEVLNYHLYLIDHNIGKARLYQSSSLFRKSSDKTKINLIWYANKWLHYYDMTALKELWFKEYDRWWLYLGDEDKQKMNIDRFKLAFNPSKEVHYNYIKKWIFF